MIWQTVSVQGAVCMRIGEIVDCGRRAAADIKRLASEINFKTDTLWRESGGFAKLDTLELEINEIKSDLFSSKKMRKIAEKNSAKKRGPKTARLKNLAKMRPPRVLPFRQKTAAVSGRGGSLSRARRRK